MEKYTDMKFEGDLSFLNEHLQQAAEKSKESLNIDTKDASVLDSERQDQNQNYFISNGNFAYNLTSKYSNNNTSKSNFKSQPLERRIISKSIYTQNYIERAKKIENDNPIDSVDPDVLKEIAANISTQNIDEKEIKQAENDFNNHVDINNNLSTDINHDVVSIGNNLDPLDPPVDNDYNFFADIKHEIESIVNSLDHLDPPVDTDNNFSIDINHDVDSITSSLDNLVPHADIENNFSTDINYQIDSISNESDDLVYHVDNDHNLSTDVNYEIDLISNKSDDLEYHVDFEDDVLLNVNDDISLNSNKMDDLNHEFDIHDINSTDINHEIEARNTDLNYVDSQFEKQENTSDDSYLQTDNEDMNLSGGPFSIPNEFNFFETEDGVSKDVLGGVQVDNSLDNESINDVNEDQLTENGNDNFIEVVHSEIVSHADNLDMVASNNYAQYKEIIFEKSSDLTNTAGNEIIISTDNQEIVDSDVIQDNSQSSVSVQDIFQESSSIADKSLEVDGLQPPESEIITDQVESIHTILDNSNEIHSKNTTENYQQEFTLEEVSNFQNMPDMQSIVQVDSDNQYNKLPQFDKSDNMENTRNLAIDNALQKPQDLQDFSLNGFKNRQISQGVDIFGQAQRINGKDFLQASVSNKNNAELFNNTMPQYNQSLFNENLKNGPVDLNAAEIAGFKVANSKAIEVDNSILNKDKYAVYNSNDVKQTVHQSDERNDFNYPRQFDQSLKNQVFQNVQNNDIGKGLKSEELGNTNNVNYFRGNIQEENFKQNGHYQSTINNSDGNLYDARNDQFRSQIDQSLNVENRPNRQIIESLPNSKKTQDVRPNRFTAVESFQNRVDVSQERVVKNSNSIPAAKNYQNGDKLNLDSSYAYGGYFDQLEKNDRFNNSLINENFQNGRNAVNDRFAMPNDSLSNKNSNNFSQQEDLNNQNNFFSIRNTNGNDDFNFGNNDFGKMPQDSFNATNFKKNVSDLSFQNGRNFEDEIPAMFNPVLNNENLNGFKQVEGVKNNVDLQKPENYRANNFINSSTNFRDNSQFGQIGNSDFSRQTQNRFKNKNEDDFYSNDSPNLKSVDNSINIGDKYQKNVDIASKEYLAKTPDFRNFGKSSSYQNDIINGNVLNNNHHVGSNRNREVDANQAANEFLNAKNILDVNTYNVNDFEVVQPTINRRKSQLELMFLKSGFDMELFNNFKEELLELEKDNIIMKYKQDLMMMILKK